MFNGLIKTNKVWIFEVTDDGFKERKFVINEYFGYLYILGFSDTKHSLLFGDVL